MINYSKVDCLRCTNSNQVTDLGFLPGDKVAINCTASPSHPAASLTWLVNKRRVDRWWSTNTNTNKRKYKYTGGW